MDSQRESEIKEEIEYLENKRAKYGWTDKDAQRYYYLKRLLGED
jgi:hypothetical protein